MKTLRLAWAFLALPFLAGAAPATPAAEELLHEGVDRLYRAVTYSWEHYRHYALDDRGPTGSRAANHGSGETEMDGYTTATIQRRRVVFWKEESAFLLKGGWRHANDLTDDDLRELRLPSGTSRGAERARHYFQPMPHEILRVVVERAKNWRKDGDMLIGEIAGSRAEQLRIQAYIESGSSLADPMTQGALGILNRRSSPIAARTSPRENPVSCTIWLAKGDITEFAVEFITAAVVPLNGEPAQRHVATRIYRTKLLERGTIRVVVEPEAKALFLKDR